MKFNRRLYTGVAALALMSIGETAAMAAETVKYTYDARGRLVKVERTGTVNNGVVTEYEVDRADNRKKVKTTGSQNPN